MRKFIPFILILVFCGCNKYFRNYSYDDNDALYECLSKLPSDTILNIKSYDGSNQVMHPDICVFLDSMGKTKFCMVLTPYPYQNAKVENPCIYISSDGLNFYEEKKNLNPLVATPAYDHNDDPDIFYDTLQKKYFIFYLETMRPDSQNIKLLESSDRVNWNSKTVVHYTLINSEKFVLSPAVTTGNCGKYFLFYVSRNESTAREKIQFFKSPKINEWDKNKFYKTNINLPDSFSPWHLNIIKYKSFYYMICNGYWGKEPFWKDPNIDKYTNLLFKSRNLKRWKFEKNILECKDIPSAECRYAYRSTGIICKNLMVIWYSYSDRQNRWYTGIKKYFLY
ncbi:MAG: hypothetical protein PHD97_02295 [Bacteroidales bacterium]|nr:hypothetical protein [Bacteroidales bacterium]